MNSKQRAYLKSLASTMNPIFQVGKASLTPEIVTAIDEALEKRELVKVSVLRNCMMTRASLQRQLENGRILKSFR